MRGGGFPLVLISALLYVFPAIYPFTYFGCCFLCYSFSLFAFSFFSSFPFSIFLVCLSSAGFSSRPPSLLLPPLMVPRWFSSLLLAPRPGLMALFLSACSLVVLTSSCSFRDLFCSSSLSRPVGVLLTFPSLLVWRLLRLL